MQTKPIEERMLKPFDCPKCGIIMPGPEKKNHKCEPIKIFANAKQRYELEDIKKGKLAKEVRMETKIETDQEERGTQISIPLPEITAEDVRKFFSPLATTKEVALFLNICKMNALNPFKREVYLVKYGNNPAQIVTGYEVYLKRADRTNKYGGFKAWTEGKIPDMKACIELYRKDWDKPLYHEVEYSEYVAKTKEGNVTKFWADKPKTMLKKVVISQAFRLAFPDELSGMPYTKEEMSTIIDVESLSEENIKEKNGKEETPIPEISIPQEVLLCSACNTSISEKVYKYSQQKYNKPLCFECQKVQ